MKRLVLVISILFAFISLKAQLIYRAGTPTVTPSKIGQSRTWQDTSKATGPRLFLWSDASATWNILTGGSGTFTTLSGDVVSASNGGNTTIQTGAVTSAKILDGTIIAGDLSTTLNNTINGKADSTLYNTKALTTAQLAYKLNATDSSLYNSKTLTTAQLAYKQPNVQFKDEGSNVGTNGGITAIDFTGAGVTSTNSSGTLTVNIPSSGGSSAIYPSRVQSNGADIKYWIVSGTPSVSFSKSSGAGAVAVSGGVIELDRVQLNLTNADLDGSNLFTCTFPTTQSSTFFQYPNVAQINTQNGAAPSSSPHTVRNSGSAPVVSFTGGTAGTNIIMKTGDLTVMGNPGSYVLVCNF